MNILKGAGAILAALIFIVITHMATDFVLESAGVIPKGGDGFMPHWVGAVALSYRTLFTIAGGYLAAMLAPEPKMRYVIILGVVGLILGILGVIANMQMKLGPDWYPVALALLSVPSVWAGGKLRIK